MLLSKTSRYALQATALLGDRWSEERAIPVNELAEVLGVPRNYLSKILHQLARQGVLTSERGPRGGFRLAAAPDEIRLIDVVETVEPGISERRCLLGRASCTDDDPCAAHERWRVASGEVSDFLESTTLADLATDR